MFVDSGSVATRTLANLRQNPHAVYMIMEPAEIIFDWRGIRVYMTLRDLATSGPAFDEYMAGLAEVAGEAAASMIHAFAAFEITEVRPLVDMGQGWEWSI